MSRIFGTGTAPKCTVSVIHQLCTDPARRVIIHQRHSEIERACNRHPVERHWIQRRHQRSQIASTSWAKHQARAHRVSTAHTQTTNSSVGQRGSSPNNGYSNHGNSHRQKLSLWLGTANEATASRNELQTKILICSDV